MRGHPGGPGDLGEGPGPEQLGVLPLPAAPQQRAAAAPAQVARAAEGLLRPGGGERPRLGSGELASWGPWVRGVHRSARSEVGLVGTGPSPLSCVTAGPTSGPSAITPAGGGLGLLSENQVFVAGRRAGRCVSESSKWQLTPGWPVWTQPLKGQGREPGARQELWAHQSGENWVPPKGAPKSCSLELTKVTGLGRRVFAGVIALRVSRCQHRARGWPAVQ